MVLQLWPQVDIHLDGPRVVLPLGLKYLLGWLVSSSCLFRSLQVSPRAEVFHPIRFQFRFFLKLLLLIQLDQTVEKLPHCLRQSQLGNTTLKYTYNPILNGL